MWYLSSTKFPLIWLAVSKTQGRLSAYLNEESTNISNASSRAACEQEKGFDNKFGGMS
jgi:hypothetical protein